MKRERAGEATPRGGCRARKRLAKRLPERVGVVVEGECKGAAVRAAAWASAAAAIAVKRGCAVQCGARRCGVVQGETRQRRSKGRERESSRQEDAGADGGRREVQRRRRRRRQEQLTEQAKASGSKRSESYGNGDNVRTVTTRAKKSVDARTRDRRDAALVAARELHCSQSAQCCAEQQLDSALTGRRQLDNRSWAKVKGSAEGFSPTRLQVCRSPCLSPRAYSPCRAVPCLDGKPKQGQVKAGQRRAVNKSKPQFLEGISSTRLFEPEMRERPRARNGSKAL